MKVISEAKKTIMTYWGHSALKSVKYRLIRFHVRAQCNEGTLLLNTVTGELVLLSSEENEYISCLPANSSKVAEDLIKHRFLVPNDFDEVKSVKQLRSIFRKLDVQSEITAFSILPTTSCNARCFYCFENGYQQVTMTPQMADSAVDYIEKVCHGKSIMINWFGGEPMVGHKRISQICDRLTADGVQFKSSMISNGSLFDENLATTARQKWHLQRIQITMDGSEKIYNRVKDYVGFTENPYYRTIKNIGLLLDQGIQVNIRLNLDFHNFDDLPLLIDDLASRYHSRNNFYVYVHELFEDEGSRPVHHSSDERIKIEENRIRLESYIKAKGCRIKADLENLRLPSLKHRYCMADNPSCVLINPLGQLGKCEHHLFNHLVGDIQYEGNGIIPDSFQYWMNQKTLEICEQCQLFPYCSKPVICEGGDGCRNDIASHQVSNIKDIMIRVFNNRFLERGQAND